MSEITKIPQNIFDNVSNAFSEGFKMGKAEGMEEAKRELTKSGHWIKSNSDVYGWAFHYGWICSECDRRQSYGASKFCPNCGAKMSKDKWKDAEFMALFNEEHQNEWRDGSNET